ncbi:SecY-interacting protein [Alteromonas sp. 07-89-2]|uniref:SecY-interacting protein n=1 Tax=Alteromonas sp. 07-89-2 TaxID=2607609 RepID=UPI00148CB783|nr:SecY-interacting protein [Alteromonas sp. 07-89-2]MDK2764093.1 SecY-interacting protein [Alteromonas macleodii]NOH60190.1 SecY-interacting protein [Alteromonas sp. 07-89-2]
MALTISAQLDKFVSSYVEQAEAEGLKIAFDSVWPSPCYETTAQDGELVRWSPTLQSPVQSFSNVEEALSLKLNPDYCEYFTRYYSDNLKANAPQGRCELLQVFNSEDFERLQQNLIGHLLMKQRLRQAPTLFFGLTDEEDFILTVVNESGEVALEHVGREPAKILAPSLAVFIEQLTPAI